MSTILPAKAAMRSPLQKRKGRFTNVVRETTLKRKLEVLLQVRYKPLWHHVTDLSIEFDRSDLGVEFPFCSQDQDAYQEKSQTPKSVTVNCSPSSYKKPEGEGR